MKRLFVCEWCDKIPELVKVDFGTEEVIYRCIKGATMPQGE